MKINVLGLILKVKQMLIDLSTHIFKIYVEQLILDQLGECRRERELFLKYVY